MINGRVLTATFLLNRRWPLQQLEDGTAARVLMQSLNALTPLEARAVLNYEKCGSFLAEDQKS